MNYLGRRWEASWRKQVLVQIAAIAIGLDTDGAWLNSIILNMTLRAGAIRARRARSTRKEKINWKMSSRPMPHQLFYHGAMLLMVILSRERLFFINTSSSSNNWEVKSRIESVEIHVCWLLLKNYLNIKSVDWLKQIKRHQNGYRCIREKECIVDPYWIT